MNEKLIQYIWQHSLFSNLEMKVGNGQSIRIIHPGWINLDEGPDFFNARVIIDNIEWVGNIEIHIKASDWKKHKHENHPQYKNIILHVVWENDEISSLGDFPTLELKNYVFEETLNKYNILSTHQFKIPCEPLFENIPDLLLKNWINRLLIERWERKYKEWDHVFLSNNYDWRTLIYIKLVENFGFKINATPMHLLAQSIPINIIEKINDQPILIESIFFGNAGLLPSHSEDEYVKLLNYHYAFLKNKYALKPIEPIWKFLRLRPTNFPTIRIAQLCVILPKTHQLFSNLLKIKNINEAIKLFQQPVNTFWNTHYHFGKLSGESTAKSIGSDAIENIVINTIAPFQFYYGKKMDDDKLCENSLELLESIPPEKNKIINLWKKMGAPCHSADQSQGLLELHNEYCIKFKCLKCSIGTHILKNK